jgi:hypothetical protein
MSERKNLKWIKVDIDGCGEKWRLAVYREDGYLYFPQDDFDCLPGEMEDCEKRDVLTPNET